MPAPPEFVTTLSVTCADVTRTPSPPAASTTQCATCSHTPPSRVTTPAPAAPLTDVDTTSATAPAPTTTPSPRESAILTLVTMISVRDASTAAAPGAETATEST